MSKIARYYAKNKKLLLTTVAAGVVAMAFAFANTGSGQRFYVNGTQVQNIKIYKAGDFTFIPGEDAVKAMGDEVVVGGPYKLILKHGDKTLEFGLGKSTYKVNNETKYISVKNVNGVNVPDNSVQTKGESGKLYVPMEVLVKELGYEISQDDYNVWVGEKPSDLTESADHSMDSIPQQSNSTTSNSNVTSNMKLSMDNGWVCPQLKSTSTDDLLEDSKTLISELEFIQNGSTSAKFDPINGLAEFITTSVGPVYDTEYSSIIFQGYHTRANDGFMKKINEINPQVLKFYFPTSWKWIHNNFINGNSLKGQRYIIDGRDTYFSESSSSVTIHFSKVNGTLGESLCGGLPSSSGTIGSSVEVSNGYWQQSGNDWSFKKNDGTYAKGWLKDKGYWYYFNINGIMKTGWIHDGGNWYYCWSNGQMATNTTVNGYKLNESGVLVN